MTDLNALLNTYLNAKTKDKDATLEELLKGLITCAGNHDTQLASTQSQLAAAQDQVHTVTTQTGTKLAVAEQQIADMAVKMRRMKRAR